MRRTAKGVRVLRGCPPYALNVYPACFGHGPRYATGGGHCASRRSPSRIRPRHCGIGESESTLRPDRCDVVPKGWLGVFDFDEFLSTVAHQLDFPREFEPAECFVFQFARPWLVEFLFVR